MKVRGEEYEEDQGWPKIRKRIKGAPIACRGVQHAGDRDEAWWARCFGRATLLRVSAAKLGAPYGCPVCVPRMGAPYGVPTSV